MVCVFVCVSVLVAVARFLVLLIKLSCQPAFYVRCLRIVVAHCVLVIVVAMICCYVSPILSLSLSLMLLLLCQQFAKLEINEMQL